MRTTINGFVIEGTPSELRELLQVAPRATTPTPQRSRRHHKTWKRWTEADKKLLRWYVKHGITTGRIALRMRRTPIAITHAKKKLQGFV